MPAYLKMAWALYKEPSLSRTGKAALGAGAVYAISPVDLIPGFIPVLGQLDDIMIALGGLKKALNSLPPEVRAEYCQKFDVSVEDIEDDLRASRRIALALVGNTAKYSARGIYLAGRAGIRLLGKLVRK